jgi:hypothetical protein
VTILQFIVCVPGLLLAASGYGLLAWHALTAPPRPRSPEEDEEEAAWLAEWDARRTSPETTLRRYQE